MGAPLPPKKTANAPLSTHGSIQSEFSLRILTGAEVDNTVCTHVVSTPEWGKHGAPNKAPEMHPIIQIVNLLLTICIASPLTCTIGTSGYYFSPITFAALDAEAYCGASSGHLAKLHEISYSTDALREWLKIRRGMKPCNVTLAWVYDMDKGGSKVASDFTIVNPNAVIDPAGIQQHDDTGLYYVLCKEVTK